MKEGALTGVKVLEVANFLAGPQAGLILSDLGADVVKVEPPLGDPTRNAAPRMGGELSPYFVALNRNKRSVCLDLKASEGQEALRYLAKQADVLLAAYPPPTLNRLGLSYSILSKLNPKLIVANISGFGDTGPFSGRPGYDFVTQGYSGLAYMVANEGEIPRTTRLSIVDSVAGVSCATSILAALVQRGRTGRGQFVDVALLDTSYFLLSYHLANFASLGEEPRRLPFSAHPYWVPCQVFPTEDSYMFLAVLSQVQFEILDEILNLNAEQELGDLSTPVARAENRDRLVEVIAKKLRQRKTGEWLEIFLDAGVPVSPMNSLAEAITNEQALSRRMILSIDVGERTYKVPGSPFKLSESSVIEDPPPGLGEHGREVFAEWVGLHGSKIEALEESGALGGRHDLSDPK